MSNYPPGVTGNEPQITGEWPCDVCGGYGYDEDEDGKHACPACRGTGIIPEDNIDLDDIRRGLTKLFDSEGWGDIDIEPSEDGYLVVYTSLAHIDGSWYRLED